MRGRRQRSCGRDFSSDRERVLFSLSDALLRAAEPQQLLPLHEDALSPGRCCVVSQSGQGRAGVLRGGLLRGHGAGAAVLRCCGAVVAVLSGAVLYGCRGKQTRSRGQAGLSAGERVLKACVIMRRDQCRHCGRIILEGRCASKDDADVGSRSGSSVETAARCKALLRALATARLDFAVKKIFDCPGDLAAYRVQQGEEAKCWAQAALMQLTSRPRAGHR